MLIAVAAMASVSCQKEEAQAPVEPKSTTITLKADVVDTKTYITEDNAVLWGTGEYVQLYFNDGTNSQFVKSSADAADLWKDEKSAMFSFDITYDESADSYVLGGIYPESATNGIDNENAAKFKLALPSVQNATASSYDPAAFIMVMKPETVTTFDKEAHLASFRRAVALNKVTLTGVNEPISSVEITVPEGKYLAGRRYIDLTTGESGDIYENGGRTNTIKVNADYTGSSIDVWFTSWGVELAAGEKLTIKMTSATKTYTRTITVNENGIKFIEGGLNKLTVDMSSAEEAVLDNLTGKYLIAAMPTKWMLMSGTNSGSYYNRVESNVSSSAEEVLSSDFYGVAGIEDCVWIVAKMEGGYSLQNIATGKYLKLTSDGNSAHTSETAVAFDITVTDKVAKVVPKEFTNRELEYNSSSPRFAFYKNTQNDIYFIPWVEDTNPRILVSTNSIEVDADATSCEFTYELRNVTGTPEVSVAADATMTEVDPSVEGNTVTVKFDPNAEDAVKTATIVLSIDGADNVEVTITQAAVEPKTPVFASLAELIATIEPTTTATKVTVTLTDEEITGIYTTGSGYRNGVFLQVGGKEIEIFCYNVPTEWEVGGTVSGTLTECDWKLYNTTWELCPADWSELTYTAPAGGGTTEPDEPVVPGENIAISVDFESDTYSEWTTTNMQLKQTGTITAKEGTYYGTTGGKQSASIATKNTYASPKSITCYVSKQSSNTNASSIWKIEVSTDGNTWTEVKTQAAASMNKGTWVEFTADLSTYTNVYVRVSYAGTTAIRNIDALTFTYSE